MASEAGHSTCRGVPGLVRRLLQIACISFCGFGVFGFPIHAYADDAAQADGDATSADEAKQRREQYLAEMRRRAEATNVYRLDEGRHTPVKMRPEPMFRYSDPLFKIVDATVWAWGAKGRPVAIQHVQLDLKGRRGRAGYSGVLYCLISLSDGLIAADWPDGKPWTAEKPGIELHPVPDPPEAAATEVRRLFQFKQIARRFSSTHTHWGRAEEQRFLPRPVVRYADTDSDLVDGAIFFLSTHGATPQLLLLIELEGKNPAEAAWKYALVRMTDGELSVRLDGKEVWLVPSIKGPRQCDTWVYLWGSELFRLLDRSSSSR